MTEQIEPVAAYDLRGRPVSIQARATLDGAYLLTREGRVFRAEHARLRASAARSPREIRTTTLGHRNLPVLVENPRLGVPRMMIEAWYGRVLADNEVIRFRDGDRRNCDLANLYVEQRVGGDYYEILITSPYDRPEMLRGSFRHLDQALVREIRRKHLEEGRDLWRVARLVGHTAEELRPVVDGAAWSHVAMPRLSAKRPAPPRVREREPATVIIPRLLRVREGIALRSEIAASTALPMERIEELRRRAREVWYNYDLISRETGLDREEIAAVVECQTHYERRAA